MLISKNLINPRKSLDVTRAVTAVSLPHTRYIWGLQLSNSNRCSCMTMDCSVISQGKLLWVWGRPCLACINNPDFFLDSFANHIHLHTPDAPPRLLGAAKIFLVRVPSLWGGKWGNGEWEMQNLRIACLVYSWHCLRSTYRPFEPVLKSSVMP